MGTTRATSGPVRCPWCARPVSTGPDRPEVCPSCGVPLARPLTAGRRALPVSLPAARARRSQRLRAVAAVLGLTSLVMAFAAVAVAPALLRQGHDDGQARDNLVAVLKAAEQIRLDTGRFDTAQPTTLAARAGRGVRVVDDKTPSASATEVSMAIYADGWYGAVHSSSGACLAAASINGNPKMATGLLAGNCTGDAARAALMPLTPAPDAISATGAPAAAPPAG